MVKDADTGENSWTLEDDFGFGEAPSMGNPTEELDQKGKLQRFLDNMRAQRSINLPTLAAQCGLSFMAVEDELRRGRDFFRGVEGVLESIKFDLWDSVLSIGRDGKSGTMRTGDLPAIKFIIDEIESGRILAKYKVNQAAPEDLEEVLSGMQLGNTKIEEKEQKSD